MDEPIPPSPEPPAEAPAEVSAEPAPEAEPATEVLAPLEASNTNITANDQPLTGLSTPAEAVTEPQEAPPPAATESAPVEEILASPPISQTVSLPASQPTQTTNWKDDYQRKGLAKTKQKIEAHLAKILARAHAKKTISNKDVVMLLRVSDATASRYLKMLVSRGQLQKTGKGRSVAYHIAML